MDDDRVANQDNTPDVTQDRRRSLRVQTLFAAAFMLVLVILAFVTLVVHATATLGMALLVAAAAMASGALLGFLFGIPRSLQTDRTTGSPDTAPLGQNTNLEQISDWLTKILVGVGLVQLGTIGAAAGRLINSISAAFEPMAGAKVIAAALLVLSSVAGFMISYIGTRTWLFQMFSQFAGGIVSFVDSRVHQAVAPVRAEVQQVQSDQENLRELIAVLDSQLDSRGAEPARGQVRDLLLRANPTHRDLAFQTAKRARRVPGVDQPAVRRTIPVFRALVDADPARYVYRAELGAALADIGDYPEAIAALDKAIELRGEYSRFDWFEFHRARARIGLIPGHAAPDDDTAAALRADLAVAWQKVSFRNYVTQILASNQASDVEYRTLDRLRPFLPAR